MFRLRVFSKDESLVFIFVQKADAEEGDGAAESISIAGVAQVSGGAG